VPTPSDRVVVTIGDYFMGNPLVGAAIRNVNWSIERNDIVITADVVSDPTSMPGAVFAFDLGPLPPGRYTTRYNGASYSFSVSSAGLAVATEYFNSTLGHYFVTADPDEVARLDDGTIAGWSRTGESFKVMFGDTVPSGALAVCRFYGLPSAGIDSHFFSASASECADVARRWPTQWLLETAAAFHVVSDGFACPKQSTPLYRVYNGRPDADHRYTTSPAIRDLMIRQGWILEGSAPNPNSELIAMCVPD